MVDEGLNQQDQMARLSGRNEFVKAPFDGYFLEVCPVFPWSHKVDVIELVGTQPAKNPHPGHSAHDVIRQADSLQIGASPRPINSHRNVRRRSRRPRESPPPICLCHFQAIPSNDHATEETGQDGPTRHHGKLWEQLQEPADPIAGTARPDMEQMDRCSKHVEAVGSVAWSSISALARNLAMASGNSMRAGWNQGGWCHLRPTCSPLLTKPSRAVEI